MSLLELAAVLSSACGIWLVTRRAVVAWPITLLACGLYAEVFREARLYSDMLLQAVYAAFCIYGWYHWLQGLRQEGTVKVETFPWQGWLRGMVAGSIGSLLLGFLMARYTNASLPHVDASLTAFSLVAQWWTTRRYLANWLLWIAVDVIYTGVFAYKNLYLTSALYAFFVLLAMFGLRSWRRAMRDEAPGELARTE
jgi:nicotinamide mononucleotide transporter